MAPPLARPAQVVAVCPLRTAGSGHHLARLGQGTERAPSAQCPPRRCCHHPQDAARGHAQRQQHRGRLRCPSLHALSRLAVQGTQLHLAAPSGVRSAQRDRLNHMIMRVGGLQARALHGWGWFGYKQGQGGKGKVCGGGGRGRAVPPTQPRLPQSQSPGQHCRCPQTGHRWWYRVQVQALPHPGTRRRWWTWSHGAYQPSCRCPHRGSPGCRRGRMRKRSGDAGGAHRHPLRPLHHQSTKGPPPAKTSRECARR
jgi:hypothetical protein